MVRYSFLVGLFHPLLHAGLSLRLRSLAVRLLAGNFDLGKLQFWQSRSNIRNGRVGGSACRLSTSDKHPATPRSSPFPRQIEYNRIGIPTSSKGG